MILQNTVKAFINSPLRSKKELLPLDYRSENSSREIIWFAQGYKTRQFQIMFISEVCTGSANPYLSICIQTPLLPRIKYKTGLTISMPVRNYAFHISYMLLLYLTSFIFVLFLTWTSLWRPLTKGKISHLYHKKWQQSRQKKIQALCKPHWIQGQHGLHWDPELHGICPKWKQDLLTALTTSSSPPSFQQHLFLLYFSFSQLILICRLISCKFCDICVMALIASAEKRHMSWLPSTDWWYRSPRLLMTFPTALQHMMKRKRQDQPL